MVPKRTETEIQRPFFSLRDINLTTKIIQGCWTASVKYISPKSNPRILHYKRNHFFGDVDIFSSSSAFYQLSPIQTVSEVSVQLIETTLFFLGHHILVSALWLKFYETTLTWNAFNKTTQPTYIHTGDKLKEKP